MKDENELTPLLNDKLEVHNWGYLKIGLVIVMTSVAAVTMHVRSSYPSDSHELNPTLHAILSTTNEPLKRTGSSMNADRVESKVRSIFITSFRIIFRNCFRMYVDK